MKLLQTDERPALSAILILLGLIMVGMFVGTLLQLGILLALSGTKDMLQFIEHPENLPNSWLALMLSQGVASLVMFVGVGLFYWLIIEKKQWQDFNFSSLPSTYIFLLVIVISLCAMPFNSWLETINSNMKLPTSLAFLENYMRDSEDKMETLTKTLTTFDSFWKLLLAILVIGVIAGVGEELIFRGLIQRKIWLGTGNIHLAIWLAAFIFSFIHFQFYGFLPRLFLGALFGYLYYFSGNLWVPIFAHILNNSVAVIIFYLINLKIITPEFEKMENVPFITALASLAITIGLLFYFKLLNDKRANNA